MAVWGRRLTTEGAIRVVVISGAALLAGCGSRNASSMDASTGGAGATGGAAGQGGIGGGGIGGGGVGGGGAGGGGTGGSIGGAGATGAAGFFIVGDIDGQTWLASYNIMPVTTNFLSEVATVEPSPPSREWQFNFTLPADPFPYTLECVSNYIEFHEIGFVPERRFVSRTATSNCAVTFVEPTVPGTLEGTFTANLTLRGTTTDYLVTNGRFRFPRAP